jgi:hypothetical protein
MSVRPIDFRAVLNVELIKRIGLGGWRGFGVGVET